MTVDIEAQCWFGVGSDEPGHIHCRCLNFPYAETVSGNVSLDLVLQLHNLYGFNLYKLQVEIYPGILVTNTITGISDTGKITMSVIVPTQLHQYDGRREFRIRANAKRRTDGKLLYNSTGWPVYLANGHPVSNFKSTDFVEGRGWETQTKYSQARIALVPKLPVSGTWSPSINLNKGSGGITCTHHHATIDPDLHNGNPGTIILDGSGPYVGTLSINTTLLTNGVHKLMLRAAQSINGITQTGVQVIPFTVFN